MLWRRTSADVSPFQFKNGKCEKKEMLVEEHPWLQVLVLSVQSYSERDSSRTLTLLCNGIRGMCCETSWATIRKGRMGYFQRT